MFYVVRVIPTPSNVHYSCVHCCDSLEKARERLLVVQNLEYTCPPMKGIYYEIHELESDPTRFSYPMYNEIGNACYTITSS